MHNLRVYIPYFESAWLTRVTIHSLDECLLLLLKFEVPPQYHKHILHNFCKQPQQPDFHFKLSEFLAAIKLTDKSGYPDNGYPDMQTLFSSFNIVIYSNFFKIDRARSIYVTVGRPSVSRSVPLIDCSNSSPALSSKLGLLNIIIWAKNILINLKNRIFFCLTYSSYYCKKSTVKIKS